MHYFDKKTHGEVLSTIINDVDTLQQGLNQKNKTKNNTGYRQIKIVAVLRIFLFNGGYYILPPKLPIFLCFIVYHSF